MAVYDDEFNEMLFENIEVAAQDITPKVITGLAIRPAAVLVNANNKGFCRAILDRDSQSFFLQNLSSIESAVNRGNVWRILCDNTVLGLIKGETLLKCAAKHIVNENEELTLTVIFQQLAWVLKYKMNNDHIKSEVEDLLSNAYALKLAEHCPSKTMQNLLLTEYLNILGPHKEAELIKDLERGFKTFRGAT